MKQRHMKERIEMEKSFKEEMKNAREAAKGELEEGRQKKKDELSDSQNQVEFCFYWLNIIQFSTQKKIL